jgi:hypothetical protein
MKRMHVMILALYTTVFAQTYDTIVTRRTIVAGAVQSRSEMKLKINAEQIISKWYLTGVTGIPTTETQYVNNPMVGYGLPIVPAGTFDVSSNGAMAQIKCKWGINFQDPGDGLNLYVKNGAGKIFARSVITAQDVGRVWAAQNGGLDIDIWIRSNKAGRNDSLSTQAHTTFCLTGAVTGPSMRSNMTGCGMYEIYGTGWNATKPETLYVSVNAASTKSIFYDVIPVLSGYAIASQRGFIRTDDSLRATSSFWGASPRMSANNNSGRMTSVAWNGRDMIGVGYAGRISLSSNGGEIWDGVPTQPAITQNFTRVVWSEDYQLWIAVGQAGIIYTAPIDGRIWTARTSGVATDIMDLKCTSTGCIAVTSASTNNYLTSTNGTTWNVATLSPSNSPAVLAVNGNQVVVGGTSGRISYYNGSTWVINTVGSSTFQGMAWSAVNSKWIAGNGVGAVYSSSDGTTWTIGTSSPAFTAQVKYMACGPYTCLYVTNDAKIYYTANATSWNQLANGGISTIYPNFCSLDISK